MSEAILRIASFILFCSSLVDPIVWFACGSSFGYLDWNHELVSLQHKCFLIGLLCTDTTALLLGIPAGLVLIGLICSAVWLQA